MLTIFKIVISLLLMSILSVTEVLGEICPDGRTCISPMRCCERTCCYEADDLDETRSHYSYGYRLSLWNMWYFWFVVLFVLMSCLGGCGYYKQRQRMIRSRSNSSLGFFSSLQPHNSSRRSRGNMTSYFDLLLVPKVFSSYTVHNTECVQSSIWTSILMCVSTFHKLILLTYVKVMEFYMASVF